MITAEIPVTPAAPTPPRLARRAWVEQVMGMPISVHVRAVEPTRPDLEAGVARVFAHLRKVDAVLSTWRADSDLLRLQHGEQDEVHAWVADVTELCLEAEERTDGLFRAWRRRDGGRLTYDPTGLVKGWAVAGAAAHLDVVPEISYSIGAGGDIVVGRRSGPVGRGPVVEDRNRGPPATGCGGPCGDRAARRRRDLGFRGAWCPRRRPPDRLGHHPLGVRDGGRARAALGRRLGDRGLGGPGPRAAADGRRETPPTPCWSS